MSRRVLKFYCQTDLPDYPLGKKGKTKYIIHFYLADDSLEVIYCHCCVIYCCDWRVNIYIFIDFGISLLMLVGSIA